MTVEKKQFSVGSDALNDLQNYIDSNFGFESPYEILEAGCGSMSRVTFPGEYRISGIDISEKQLERNDLLSGKICADIQHHDLGDKKYDVIICWDVLEHLPNPGMAMRRFKKSVKKGGLVILSMPNVLSLKGLLTKFTPHWVHVMYYCKILKRPNAGKNDTAPFETYLRWVLSPEKIKNEAFRDFLWNTTVPWTVWSQD